MQRGAVSAACVPEKTPVSKPRICYADVNGGARSAPHVSQRPCCARSGGAECHSRATGAETFAVMVLRGGSPGVASPRGLGQGCDGGSERLAPRCRWPMRSSTGAHKRGFGQQVLSAQQRSEQRFFRCSKELSGVLLVRLGLLRSSMRCSRVCMQRHRCASWVWSPAAMRGVRSARWCTERLGAVLFAVCPGAVLGEDVCKYMSSLFWPPASKISYTRNPLLALRRPTSCLDCRVPCR